MPSHRGGREGSGPAPTSKTSQWCSLEKDLHCFLKKTFRKTNSPWGKILERSSGSGWWGASVCMTECQYKDWFTAFYWERPVEIRRNKTSALLKATVQPLIPLTFVLFLYSKIQAFQQPIWQFEVHYYFSQWCLFLAGIVVQLLQCQSKMMVQFWSSSDAQRLKMLQNAAQWNT